MSQFGPGRQLRLQLFTLPGFCLHDLGNGLVLGKPLIQLADRVQPDVVDILVPKVAGQLFDGAGDFMKIWFIVIPF